MSHRRISPPTQNRLIALGATAALLTPLTWFPAVDTDPASLAIAIGNTTINNNTNEAQAPSKGPAGY